MEEIQFVCQILREIGINEELPIVVRVNNIGAIFMSENIQVLQGTKHVDTRLRFVNQFVSDGFLKSFFSGPETMMRIFFQRIYQMCFMRSIQEK